MTLARELEQIKGADMVAVAFHEPRKLSRFEELWRARASASPRKEKTLEQLNRDADELWALHTLRKRPVS